MRKLQEHEVRIRDEHKIATDNFYKEHGRHCTTKDEEYWTISDSYKQAHQVYIDIRKAEEAKQRALEAKEEQVYSSTGKTVPTERFCAAKDCDAILVPTGKRGRPATKCEAHRK